MLLHVTTAEAWDAARAGGDGVQAGLGATPFLHLCTEGQLGFVLSRHFAGRRGLLVLELDPAGLDVRWEESEPGMDPFPHLYGTAPISAVIGVRAV